MRRICNLRFAICDLKNDEGASLFGSCGRKAPVSGAQTAASARSYQRKNRCTPLWRTALIALLLALAPLMLASCITNHLANPAATQPATAINPITTQPSYYLDMPAAAQVQAGDFDTLWTACEKVARSYGYQLDREDYRTGLLTTVPMVSKNIQEPWRKDAGTVYYQIQDSLQTIRRTLRFEIKKDESGAFAAVPKVLMERQSVLEHRITSVTQYRGAFSGPRVSSIYTTDAVNPVPARYWTPIGRDQPMEKQVATAVRDQIQRAARKRG